MIQAFIMYKGKQGRFRENVPLEEDVEINIGLETLELRIGIAVDSRPVLNSFICDELQVKQIIKR